jgi:tRNA(adenine34) deaminase
MNDQFFMREALKEAEKAFEADEVPVGAVLVHENRVIARGHNQVELLQDATAHAEMICLTAGAAVLGNWRLANTTLYCTLEPCPMCAGALLASRVERLVWAAPDLRLGANGSWIDLFAQKHPMHSIEITGRVLEEESAHLMVSFFQSKRGRLQNSEAVSVDETFHRVNGKKALSSPR